MQNYLGKLDSLILTFMHLCLLLTVPNNMLNNMGCSYRSGMCRSYSGTCRSYNGLWLSWQPTYVQFYCSSYDTVGEQVLRLSVLNPLLHPLLLSMCQWTLLHLSLTLMSITEEEEEDVEIIGLDLIAIIAISLAMLRPNAEPKLINCKPKSWMLLILGPWPKHLWSNVW